MSVSREWNSLKAVWSVVLLFLAARIFLGGQFLLTPEEALYWQTSQYPPAGGDGRSPVLTAAIWLSTSLFGNSEMAVRLPAVLGLALAALYMSLIAASMFSWHTALHVTLLSHGILQLNLAALVVTPFSLLLPCWAAVCFHASQAMHENRTDQWLFAGFWFGAGLLCDFSMILLLPFLMLCFILIKPFRICLLYAGPWFGFLLASAMFLLVSIWQENINLLFLIDQANWKNFAFNLIPDAAYSLQFIIDQVVLLTPVVLLLILAAWIGGGNKRHLVKPDVQFLLLTSLPLFLLYLVFPVFADSGTAWTAPAYISGFILIAGLHSSTRSNFKGRPSGTWIFGLVTAYCITVPLVLQIAYPGLPVPVHLRQTNLAVSGWDLLGREVHDSALVMPSPEETFIFSMEPKIAAELAFYTPGNHRAVSLDHWTRTHRQTMLEQELQLIGRDGVGLVSTKAALDKAELLFDRVELERTLTVNTLRPGSLDENRTFYLLRGFGFRLK